MRSFLVETYAPAGTSIGEIDARTRLATAEVAHTGQAVRYLHSIFVPEDETSFHFFEADSSEAVHAASKRAGLVGPHCGDPPILKHSTGGIMKNALVIGLALTIGGRTMRSVLACACLVSAGSAFAQLTTTTRTRAGSPTRSRAKCRNPPYSFPVAVIAN